MTQHFSKTILASVFIAALCAFAPAPKVKSVTFKIFQKGKEVAIEDHKCSLKKAPFEIVFEISNATSAEIWTNAAFKSTVYKQFKNEDAIDSIEVYQNSFPKPVVKGKPAPKVKAKNSDENQDEEETPKADKKKGKAEKTFVEKPDNEDKLIRINPELCYNWYYKNDNDNSFDKVEKKGGVITCTRTVKAFYNDEENAKIKIAEAPKSLYLTFYSMDFNKAKKTKTEMLKDFVKIAWEQ